MRQVNDYTPINDPKSVSSRKLDQTISNRKQENIISSQFTFEIGSEIRKSGVEMYHNENVARQFITLMKSFDNKWEHQKQHFSEFPKANVSNLTATAVYELLEFNPEYLTYDLSSDASVFIQSKIKDHNIYLEIFFTDEPKDDQEAVINIYLKGNLILVYVGPLEEAIDLIYSKISPTKNISTSGEKHILSESSLTATAI